MESTQSETKETRMRFDVALRITDEAEFILLKLAIHWHKKDDEHECPLRSGLVIGLLGFEIAIGLWK